MRKETRTEKDFLSGRHYRIDFSRNAYEETESIFAPRFVLMGVGSAGANLVGSRPEWAGKNTRSIAINTTIGKKGTMADFAISLGTGMCRFEGRRTGIIPDNIRTAIIDGKAAVKTAVGRPDVAFIISELSETTAFEVTGVAAEIAKAAGALTILLAFIPSAPEDQSMPGGEKADLGGLKEFIDSIFIVYAPQFGEESSDVPLIGFSEAISGHLDGIMNFVNDLMTREGLVCLDFSDIKETFLKGRFAGFAVARARGKKSAERAAERVLGIFKNHYRMKTFEGALVSFTTGGIKDIEKKEVDQVMELVRHQASHEIVFAWRMYFDETLKDETLVSMILTGIKWKELKNDL